MDIYNDNPTEIMVNDINVDNVTLYNGTRILRAVRMLL